MATARDSAETSDIPIPETGILPIERRNARTWLRAHLSTPVTRAVGLAFAVYVAGTALTALERLVLARLVGPVNFGIYTLCMTWITVLALVPAFGLDIAALRFAAQYRSNQAWQHLRGLIRSSVTASVTLSVLTVIALLLVIRSTSLIAEPETRMALSIGALLIPALVSVRLLQALTQTAIQPGIALIPARILIPFGTMLGAALISVEPIHRDATGLMAVRAASITIAAIVLALWTLSKVCPAPRMASCSRYEIKKWLDTAFPSLWNAGIYAVLGGLDILMLGWLRDPTEAGVYSVAGALSEVVVFGLVAANAKIGPLVAGHNRAEQGDELQARISDAVTFILMVAVIAAIGLVVGGYPLLLLFGEAFGAAYLPLCVLVVGRLLQASTGLATYILSMSGFPRVPAVVLSVAVIVNAALNLLLIPYWGMMGAAIATAVVVSTWNLLCHLLCLRRTGLDSSPFSIVRSKASTRLHRASR